MEPGILLVTNAPLDDLEATLPTSCTTGAHAHHDVYEAQCPCRPLLELLANKWSALAIGSLEAGPQRFGALRRVLVGVSPKVLTQTLRRLEEVGFVDRVVYPEVPLHVEYSLTALGFSAAVPLAQLRVWVEEHLDEMHDPRSSSLAVVAPEPRLNPAG